MHVGSFSCTPLSVLYEEFVLHAPFCFMRGVSLTHPGLFYVWRFSCKLLTFVSRRLTNQCKNKVCWVKSVYRASDQAGVSCHQNDTANEPNGSSQSITDWTDRPGFHGVAIGICLWLTQLVWIRLGTDRQRLRANTASVSTPSVTGFCFTSLVFFSFFLSFTFTSDGLIVITVSASIYVHIVYSIPNLNGWLDGWMSGFLLITWRLSLAQTMPPYMHRFCCSHCTALCGVFVYYMLNGAVR